MNEFIITEDFPKKGILNKIEIGITSIDCSTRKEA
jgi:hypothetical protein